MDGKLDLVNEDDPLEQGLKLRHSYSFLPARTVNEDDPLEQGLKLLSGSCKPLYGEVNEDDPLEQGLKLAVPQVEGGGRYC